jgi:hypothetical protein
MKIKQFYEMKLMLCSDFVKLQYALRISKIMPSDPLWITWQSKNAFNYSVLIGGIPI